MNMTSATTYEKFYAEGYDDGYTGDALGVRNEYWTDEEWNAYVEGRDAGFEECMSEAGIAV